MPIILIDRFHPEYRSAQNKNITNISAFDYYINTITNVNTEGPGFTSEIILNEGDMLFIPSYFYYSISSLVSSSSSSTTASLSSISSSWISMQLSSKISYLTSNLFLAAMKDPPFSERDSHGTITIIILLNVNYYYYYYYHHLLGIKLASIAYVVKYALAKWGYSVKTFINLMKKRYVHIVNNDNNDKRYQYIYLLLLFNSNSNSCIDVDNCVLTESSSICTSRDILFGTKRYAILMIIIILIRILIT